LILDNEVLSALVVSENVKNLLAVIAAAALVTLKPVPPNPRGAAVPD
jgi:hypothetical protein